MRTKNNKAVSIFTLIILMIVFQSQITLPQQQQKLAQTGMKFLNVSPDARISALGDAVTSLENNSSAMFYNPAGMARLNTFSDVSLGYMDYGSDLDFTYYEASVAFAPEDGDYGVFGISILSVDYGDFYGTVRANNDQGFLDVGIFSPTAMAIGFGYAKALSEKFAIGGNIKYVRQDLGPSVIGGVTTDPTTGAYTGGITETNKLDVLAFDFGVIYNTGFKSLDLGMSVRNFAREVKYKQESFQLPLIFQLGVSFNFSDLLDIDKNMHSILLSVDANHPRDYPEQILVGLEYTFMNVVSFRGGFSAPNDERNFSAGIGLKKDLGGLNLGVDYSYAPFGVFGDIQRITVKLAY